jgi:hydrogenase maturation protease
LTENVGQGSTSKQNITVLGTGNLLLKDEGIGVHIIQRMEKMELPDNVKLVDGGVAGINLPYLIEGADKLIVIDCVDAEVEPGAIFRFTPDDVDVPQRDVTMSFHDIGLLEALELAKQDGRGPKSTVIIGVQPKEIEWGMELTPEIEKVVPDIIDAVLKELEE